MFGDVIDPFGKWADFPEIPEPKQEPSEKDITAIQLVGCLYTIVAMTLFFIFTLVIYMLL